jgi:nitrate reductase delta subunit
VRLRPRGRSRPPYKLVSVLLQYPDAAVIDAEGDIVRAAAALPASREKRAIEDFLRFWVSTSPIERAQTYVETFDLQKHASLYMTYYLHGDKRQRGAALVRLKKLYEAGGLVFEGGELPDYLPAMLEFAAFAPPEYGECLLTEVRPAIEVLRARLHDQGSPYACLVDAISHWMPRLTLPEAAQVKRLVLEGPPTERVGLEPYGPPESMPGLGGRP